MIQITTVQKINNSPPTATTALISPKFDVTGAPRLLSLRMEVVKLTVDEGGDFVVDADVVDVVDERDGVTAMELLVDVYVVELLIDVGDDNDVVLEVVDDVTVVELAIDVMGDVDVVDNGDDVRLDAGDDIDLIELSADGGDDNNAVLGADESPSHDTATSSSCVQS